jgi:multicomponent Na+:H+ antiporter subunit F
MSDVLLTAAGIILVTVAAGLARVLYGPREVDRIMAVQLFGAGGIAALLLAASATEVVGVENVALGLALLSSFASVAFVSASPARGPSEEDESR